MHLPSDQHEESSYIIFKKDGDIFARNGDSGNIEFSGTDAATVIQDAINALGANGGVIAGKIEQELEISSTIDPCDNLILRNLWLRAANELNDNIIRTSAKRTNVTIRDCILDGNKANQTYTGTRGDHTLIKFRQGDENIKILNNELHDALAGAGISMAAPAINPLVRNNYIHDMGTSTEPCDGIYCHSTRGRIEGNWITNVSDSQIATDDSQKIIISKNKIWNTDSWNTNVGQTGRGVTCKAFTRNWTGTIEDNEITNLGSSINGITNVADTGLEVRATIVGNILNADLYNGIYIGTDGAECSVSDNRLSSLSNRGIVFRGVDSEISGNTVRGVSDQSIRIGGNGNAIVGNTVRNGGASGIIAADGITDLTISENVVDGCTDGIRLHANNTDCVVTGNRSLNNSGYGVREVTGGDYNIINANDARGNTTGGVSTVGANTVVTDNLP